MKRRYTFALVCILAGMLADNARAFTPGPDIIRECPLCKAPFAMPSMNSGNTAGGQRWTDGKIDLPMWLDTPMLVKCPGCHGLIRTKDVDKVGERQWGDDASKWRDTRWAERLAEEDYLQIIAAEKPSGQEERYLRHHAWWAANDAFRTNNETANSFSPEQEANLLVLASNARVDSPEERLLKAEIFRELKRFDECMALLSAPFDYSEYRDDVLIIKGLAIMKISTVKRISPRNSSTSILGTRSVYSE